MDAYDEIAQAALPSHRQTPTPEEQTNRQDAGTAAPGAAPSGSAPPRAAGGSSLRGELEEALQGLPWKQWNAYFTSAKQRGESFLQDERAELARLQHTLQSALSIDRAEGDAGSNPVSLFTHLRNAARTMPVSQADLHAAESQAEAYLSRFGTNLSDLLKDAVRIEPPAPATPGRGKSPEEQILAHVEQSDRLLREEPDADDQEDVDDFTAFMEQFDVDAHTQDIARLLDQAPALRRRMDALVPQHVPYADFWRRFFYRLHVLEDGERRRQLAMASLQSRPPQASSSSVDWDDDEPEHADTEKQSSTETLQPQPPPASESPPVSRPSTDSSYDVVSSTTSQSQPRTAAKPDKPDEEDDDVDWE